MQELGLGHRVQHKGMTWALTVVQQMQQPELSRRRQSFDKVQCSGWLEL